MHPIRKDFATIAISLAILATFGSSIMLWQPHANAARSSANSVSQVETTFGPKAEAKEAAALRESRAEDRKQLAEAQRTIDRKYTELEQNIAAYLKQQAGTYGFNLYIQLDQNGILDKTIGYNSTEVFKMASTFKLPVNLYLYRQIAANKLSLDTKLTFGPDDYEQGTGSLQYRGPGGKYTVKELASRSIRESDNVAINMLIDALDRSNISNYMAQIGGHQIAPEGTPTGTPADLVAYMKDAVALTKEQPELGNLLMEDLKNTNFSDRTRAGTPANIEVGHKIGNLGGVVNDIAIIYAKTPYILAMMSKNVPNDSVAAAVEAQVAKMIYESIGR